MTGSIDSLIELLSQRRATKANGGPDYDRLNRLAKASNRRDKRNDMAERIQNSPPFAMFWQLKNVITHKRGPSAIPVDLSPDDLNKYFISIGTEPETRH